MASTSDKITDTRNGARPNSARVTSGRAAGANSLSCDNLSGWPTNSKVHFVTYQIDSSSNVIAGTQLDCSGIVAGNGVTSMTVIDGSDNGNSVNDVVEMLPTSAWGQDLSDAIMSQHSRTGAHTTVTATSVNTGTLVVTGGSTFPAGDIGTADIASNAISYAKLLGTIFSSQLTTYTNPGTAGGSNSFFYINLGGIKLFWGLTAGVATGTNNATVTFPTSFFSTVQFGSVSPGNASGTNNAYASFGSLSSTTGTLQLNAVAGSGTMSLFLFVIGT